MTYFPNHVLATPLFAAPFYFFWPAAAAVLRCVGVKKKERLNDGRKWSVIMSKKRSREARRVTARRQ